MDDVIDKLKVFFINDLRKPEFDKFERARLIKDYMGSHKLSIRRFASEFGFAKSTVEDWLLWNKISEDEYKEKIDSGFEHVEVYRGLRSNKRIDYSEACVTMNERLKRDIVRYNFLLKRHDKKNTDAETKSLISEFKDVLDKII